MSSSPAANPATDPNLPHNTQAPEITGVISTMLVLVTLVVAARFWIRWSLSKGKFGADDWCILAAWVFAVAFDLDPLNQVKFGLGKHIWDLPVHNQFAKSLELYYFGELLYFVCIGFTKVAVLVLYLRLAASKRLRILMWTMMAFVIVSICTFIITCVFQCIPIHKAWDLTGLVEGHCYKVNTFFYATAGVDIAQDIIIYILPLKMLYQLQVPKRQKFALMGVFALGGFVVVTGMIRLWYLKGAENTLDPSYDNVGGAVWSCIECNTGVICASLPHFKPLFDHFFPSLMGRSRGTMNIDNPSGSRSTGGKYIKQSSQKTAEYELESHDAWNDAVGDNGHITNNIQAGSVNFNSSEERLKGVDSNGIYKSTQIVFSRTEAV